MNKKIKIDILNDEPLITVYKNFLSNKECRELFEFTKGKLQDAKVGINKTKNVMRTGKSCFMNPFKNKLGYYIVKKISLLIDEEIDNVTNLQIVNYQKNQSYAYHYDSIGIKNGILNSEININRFQRKISVIAYLNDVLDGGETFFPKLNVKIKPEIGKLLVFYNLDKQNKLNTNTLHAGLPVIEGEKWILVFWFLKK